jgi:hypothetical protein
MLLGKSIVPHAGHWSGGVVEAVLRDYLVYAMRIEKPDDDACFAAMAAWVANAGEVRLESLASYLGRDKSVAWQEVRDRRDPAFARAMKMYKDFFKDRDISISEEDFAHFLDEKRRADLRYAYHLWVAPSSFGDGVDALASFFTLGHCGFGGYALRRRIHGTERGKPTSGAVALAAVEERMRRDNPTIKGWFIECDPGGAEYPSTVFYRHGFREVALEYRQPPLPGVPCEFESARVLRLLYKPFGAPFGEPELSAKDFLAAVEDIFAVVYRMTNPVRSHYHQQLRRQLTAADGDRVPFHASAPRDRRRLHPRRSG